MKELERASRAVRERQQFLERLSFENGLTRASIARHKDVLGAEATQIEALMELLKPAASVLESLGEGYSTGKPSAASRSGWKFDRLIPYLLRDWTDNLEISSSAKLIGRALHDSVRDAFGKLIAFAGCGAAGLMAELRPEFPFLLGFDLTLPILCAARVLLDGGSLEFTMPRAIHRRGRITLGRRSAAGPSDHCHLVAMDALETAFRNGSVDCIVTSFFLDLLPDPRKLAAEIHRVLGAGGVWINYGPSGPLAALWRFESEECKAFFEASGFEVVRSTAHRATYLDLSRECESWSYQSHMCYLTVGKKVGTANVLGREPEPTVAVESMVPQYFPNTYLVERRRLGGDDLTALLRHERTPGRVETFTINRVGAELIALIDGNASVAQLAEAFEKAAPGRSARDAVDAFGLFFSQGLIGWRQDGR